MTTLTLDGVRYLADDLPSLSPTDFSPLAETALRFCQRWLADKTEFTLHTSGSTGPPKAIDLSRQQMKASATLTGQAVGLKPGMRSLVCLSPQYIAGVMMLVRGLVLGLNTVLIEPTSRPFNFTKFAKPPNAPFDFTALVPLQLQNTLAHPSDLAHLRRLQAVLIGGAPISPSLQHQLEQTCPAPPILYHTYGMTETVSHVALRPLNGPHASERFTPLPGVSLRLDDRGCLVIAGPMTGGESVITNDRVALADDGSMLWLGRVDRVINSGGVKIQPEQVETAIARWLQQSDDPSLAQRRFFIGALPSARLGQKVVAVFEGSPLPAETESALKMMLGQSLGEYARPRLFRYLPKFEQTASGKIDRPATLNRLQR